MSGVVVFSGNKKSHRQTTDSFQVRSIGGSSHSAFTSGRKKERFHRWNILNACLNISMYLLTICYAEQMIKVSLSQKSEPPDIFPVVLIFYLWIRATKLFTSLFPYSFRFFISMLKTSDNGILISLSMRSPIRYSSIFLITPSACSYRPPSFFPSGIK